MTWHRDASTGDIHVIFDQTYADTTARDADTTWNGDAENIGKVVQVSTGPTFYILLSISPTWTEITTLVSQSLAGSLAVGNVTGGSDIIVETTDMITIIDAPVADTDGANKLYVDGQVASADTLAEVLALGNTSGGTNLLMSDGDKIGIQQPSPAASLHVSGILGDAEPTAILDSVGGVSMRLKSAGGAPSYLEAQSATTGASAWKLGLRTGSVFEIGYGTAGDWIAESDFSIKSTGEVGIGTIDPLALLHISAPAGSAEPGIRLDATGDASIRIDGDAGKSYIEIANTFTNPFAWQFGVNDTNDLAISYSLLGTFSTIHKLTMDITGKVGIGVASPTAFLDITGSASSGVTALRLRSGDADTAPANAYQALFSYNGDVNFTHNIRTRHNNNAGAGNAIDFYVWHRGVDAATDIGTLHTMTLDNGFVGIGTTDPVVELDVVGKGAFTDDLAVNTDALFVDASTGFVGIGDATPENPLEVRNSLDANADPSARANYGLNLYQSTGVSGSGSGIGFIHSGFVQGSIISTDRGGGNAGALDFYVDGGADFPLAARMDWNTHFGIGVSPTANLHLLGAAKTNTTGTCNVTNGSPTVVTSADLTSYFNVGDAVRITNAAPVETSIYTVDAIDASSITLDSNYTGTTDSTGTVSAKHDADLVLIQNGDGTDYFTVDRSGKGIFAKDLDVVGDITAGAGTFVGDFAVDVDTLFVDKSENSVGVGTTAPKQSLHINPSGTSNWISTTDRGLLITRSTGPGIVFEDLDEAVGEKVMAMDYDNAAIRFNSLSDDGTTVGFADILKIGADKVVQTSGHTVATIDHNIFEIWTEADFPNGSSGGKTILDSGMYIFKTNINITNRFELRDGASVEWIMPNGYQNALTYLGSGDTFISTAVGGTSSFRILYPGITINIPGDAVTFCDIVGSFGVEFIFINATGTLFDLGPVVGSSTGIVTSRRFYWLRSSCVGWKTGFRVSNTDRLYCDIGTLTSSEDASSAFFTLDNIQAFVNMARMDFFLNSADASIFDIRPINKNDIYISRCDQRGLLGNFFAIGDTGQIASIADIGISPIGVDGAAAAVVGTRFSTQSVHSLVIGALVTHIGFSELGYNGEWTVVDVPSTTTYEIADILYTATDNGTMHEEQVKVTDIAHGLSNGDQINITETDDYNAGYEVFNVAADTFDIWAVWVATETGVWDTGSLDSTNKYVTTTDNGEQRDSGMSAEGYLANNALVTSIPAVDALVIINAVTWTGEQEELLTVKTDGTVRQDGIKANTLEVGADVSLSPATATKTLQAQLAGLHYPSTLVTFTNATNIVNDGDTERVDGDLITFHDNIAVLPTGLREDVIYYVVNKATNTFQLSYTLGGSVISFPDNGTGQNAYLTANVHGSAPKKSIASGTPQDISPKALINAAPTDEIVVVISNKSDAVDITCDTGYTRSVGA